MLNNKGWGLGAFLGFSIIIIFFIIVAAVNAYKAGLSQKPTGEIQFNNSEFSYSNLENTLLSAGKRYFTANNGTSYVSSDTLIKENYINSLSDSNYNKCTGYVKKTDDNYKSYIKCANSYQTSGYESEFDK